MHESWSTGWIDGYTRETATQCCYSKFTILKRFPVADGLADISKWNKSMVKYKVIPRCFDSLSDGIKQKLSEEWQSLEGESAESQVSWRKPMRDTNQRNSKKLFSHIKQIKVVDLIGRHYPLLRVATIVFFPVKQGIGNNILNRPKIQKSN